MNIFTYTVKAEHSLNVHGTKDALHSRLASTLGRGRLNLSTAPRLLLTVSALVSFGREGVAPALVVGVARNLFAENRDHHRRHPQRVEVGEAVGELPTARRDE